VKHIRQFYFPSAWQYELWGGANRGSTFKIYSVAAITLMALFTSALLIILRGGTWVYPFVFLIMPSLPYILVQPTPRYHYLISTLSIYLAVSIFALIRWDKVTNSVKCRPGQSAWLAQAKREV
jgi:hypothetical protein